MPFGATDRSKRTTINLFRIAGIRISIDYSWFIVFLLIFWSLSVGYFPRETPGEDPFIYWIAGLFATVLFFLSVILHEVAHSLTAIRSGLQIPEITLFIFGGVSKLSEEAKNPADEFKIAVVGPLASFVLAFIFFVLERACRRVGFSFIAVMFGYLTWINMALGIFNLLPGFPLDGGRLVRAFLWWKTGSITSATKYASDIGKGLAVALMLLGGFQVFKGMLISGLWLILIGAFLRSVAEGSYQEILMRQSLEGVLVHEVMVKDAVSVASYLPVSRLVSSYFLRYGYKGYPVVKDGGIPVGVVELSQIRNVPEDEQEVKTVGEVMTPISPEITVGPEVTLVDALKQLARTDVGRLLVVRDGRLAGIVTKTGLYRFLEIKRILRL